MLIPASSGPTVTLHTPLSPSFVIAPLAPPAIQPPDTLTSEAFGAYTRNVTRLSACTSGDTTPSAAGGAATTTAVWASQANSTTAPSNLITTSASSFEY